MFWQIKIRRLYYIHIYSVFFLKYGHHVGENRLWFCDKLEEDEGLPPAG